MTEAPIQSTKGNEELKVRHVQPPRKAPVGDRGKGIAVELFQGVPQSTVVPGKAFIVTDSFVPYESATRQAFSSQFLCGQVLKTRRNDRITKVEIGQVIRPSAEFEKPFEES